MPTMTTHTDTEAFADAVVARAATLFDRLEVRAKTAAALAGSPSHYPALAGLLKFEITRQIARDEFRRLGIPTD